MDRIDLTSVSPDEFLLPEESLTSYPSNYEYDDSVLYANLLPSPKRRCLSPMEEGYNAKSSSASVMPRTTKNNKASATAIATCSLSSVVGATSSNTTQAVHPALASSTTFDSHDPSNTKAVGAVTLGRGKSMQTNMSRKGASSYGGTQHTGYRGMTTGLLAQNTTVMAITEGCGVATEVGICYMYLPSGKCTLAQVIITTYVTDNDTETPFQQISDLSTFTKTMLKIYLANPSKVSKKKRRPSLPFLNLSFRS